MTTPEVVDLTFLAKQNEKILAELAAVRREMADVRFVAIGSADYSRRLDRRIGEVKDDWELILKAELSGSLANFETRLGSSLDRIEDRLESVERKLP